MSEGRRTGKGSKDIFQATTAVPAVADTSGRSGPGRPPVHDEPWTKVTVVLFNRQIVFLDRLASDIRAETGAAIKRAELIRALVDALAESDIDLTTASSEGELKDILMAKMGSNVE